MSVKPDSKFNIIFDEVKGTSVPEKKAVVKKEPANKFNEVFDGVKKKDGLQDAEDNLPASSKSVSVTETATKPSVATPLELPFKKNWLDPTLSGGAGDPTPKILFSDYDKEELRNLQAKYQVSTDDFREKLRQQAGAQVFNRPTVSRRPFVSEYENSVAVENHIKDELSKIKSVTQKLRAGSPNPYQKEQDALEEDLKTVQSIKKKTAAELTIEGENKIDAVIRTDQSGNLFKKTMNRLQLTNPLFAGTGAANISLETESKINQLPSQFVTWLNYLRWVEPVEYERISKNLAEGLPISESQIATITAQGIDLEEARLERNLQKNIITPEEYNKKATELNTVRKNNILDNRETLRAFLAYGIAEKGDYYGKLSQLKNKGIPQAAMGDYLFGHTWNYTDEQIKYFGEQYAKENSIDPQDARVQAAIKYLQENEGSIIMQNSIAKAGVIREFFKGAAEPIRGVVNAIEDLGKSSNDIYAEGQSQGNVNVSEKRLKAEDTGVRGIVNDVVKGTGQFASQVALAYLTSGGVGIAGRTILGRAGTAALAGDIVAADMTAADIVGKTLVQSKDALATFITSYAQVYDSNLKNALNYTSDNALAKRAAAINSSIEGATELFLSPLEIAKGIAAKFRSKGTTKELIDILSDKALEKTPNKLSDFLTKTIKGVAGTSKVAGAEISEEMVTQISDYVTNAYLNPNSESFQNRDLMNELGITAYQTGLSMAVPALLNGISAANANTFSKGSLLIAAQNRQRLVDDLKENLALKKISQDEYNSKVQLINTAAVANAQIPKKSDNSTLSTDEKADYVFSRVAEAMLANKVKQSKDEAEKTILGKKIKEQQNFRTKILGGEAEETKEPVYKVDGNDVSRADFLRLAKGEDSDQYNFEVTGDEEVQNFLRGIGGKDEDVVEEKTTPVKKDAIQLLNEARDTGKLGVFKDMEDEAALKIISQQAQNLDEKGQPFTGENAEERGRMAMEGTKNQFGEQLVNAAIEKYPAEIKQKDENKTTEEKEPVLSKSVKSKLAAIKEKRKTVSPSETKEVIPESTVSEGKEVGDISDGISNKSIENNKKVGQQMLLEEVKNHKDSESLLRSGGFSDKALDFAAFGFTENSVKEMMPNELTVKWKDDMLNPPEKQKKSGLSKEEWAKTVDLSEPIDVSYDGKNFNIEDGHHRYYAAKILNKPLRVNLEIKANPISKLSELGYDEFHRDFFDRNKLTTESQPQQQGKDIVEDWSKDVDEILKSNEPNVNKLSKIVAKVGDFIDKFPTENKLVLAELTGDKSNAIKRLASGYHQLAAEYAKAKINDSNPELVKAVEDLLGKPKETTPTPTWSLRTRRWMPPPAKRWWSCTRPLIPSRPTSTRL
jgi:hypothetical protein